MEYIKSGGFPRQIFLYYLDLFKVFTIWNNTFLNKNSYSDSYSRRKFLLNYSPPVFLLFAGTIFGEPY